ncbi:MAG: ABC transporter substrate-binding protein [Planctomycetes bacterium]|nr:ABC transporter substrate-binding protein [Planctomycetota bacterium]
MSLTLTDRTFTDVTIEQPLRRVVSLVPSTTETIFALGRGEILVGRTRYCISPAAQVKAVPTVGGTKDPDLAAIAALQPQLVLAVKEENRRQDIEALRARGLNVYVDSPETVEEALAHVAVLGRMLDASEAADDIVRVGARAVVGYRERAAEREQTHSLRVQAPPHPRPRVMAFIWKDPWMAVGRDTYLGDVIATLGGTHVLARHPDRYPRLEPAQVEAFEPDILLFPSEPWHFKEADLDFWREQFPHLPAVRHNRLRLCDGQDAVWFGARTPAALKRLAPLLEW